MSIHKSMRRSACLLVAALVMLPAVAIAQQAVPTVITLEQAIDIALERNPTVLQAQNSARLNTLTVRQQRNILIPSLRVSSSTKILH